MAKRIFLAATVVVSLFVLVACGNDGQADYYEPDYEQEQHAPELTTPPCRAGYQQLDNPFGLLQFNPFNDTTWDSFLLTALPASGIFIFGDAYGQLTLYYGGDTAILGGFSTSGFIRGVFPSLLYHDFNGDGRKEIAMIIHAGAGTGVSVSNLYLLTKGVDGWNVFQNLIPSQVEISYWLSEAEMHAKVSSSGDELYFFFAEEGFVFRVPGHYAYGELGEFIGLSYGNIAGFSFVDSQIIFSASIGAGFEGMSPMHPLHLGDVRARVIFDGQSLFLDEIIFQRSPFH
ncbi:MAG: hypothetical protein FWB74_07065 [Defluviitaleaceae bacterium]|nr:hypothetical protein [Defluviitaleaceae bacterium]